MLQVINRKQLKPKALNTCIGERVYILHRQSIFSIGIFPKSDALTGTLHEY